MPAWVYALLWVLAFSSCGSHSQWRRVQVSASGVFEMRVGPWNNELGVTADGRCCEDGQRRPVNDDVCPNRCRTFVRVCLSHYQATLPDRPDCTYGSVLTSADQFGDLIQHSNVDIPFEFAWPVITSYNVHVLSLGVCDAYVLNVLVRVLSKWYLSY